MFIPLRQENMRGHRWPYITFALIALNIVIFLLTHGPMDREKPQIVEVHAHLILLDAMHPELRTPPDVSQFLENTKKRVADDWEHLASLQRPIFDPWDEQIRKVEAGTPAGNGQAFRGFPVPGAFHRLGRICLHPGPSARSSLSHRKFPAFRVDAFLLEEAESPCGGSAKLQSRANLGGSTSQLGSEHHDGIQSAQEASKPLASGIRP